MIMNNHVIKEGSIFLLCNEQGDIVPESDTGHGLYLKDTRFLSNYKLYINKKSPQLLGSRSNKSYLLSTTLMEESKDRGAIEVIRETIIYDGVLYERLSVTNYYLDSNEVEISLSFDADFQDMFIVRKYREGKVGHTLDPIVEKGAIAFRYVGIDEIKRTTYVTWDYEATISEDNKELSFQLELSPGQTKYINVNVVPLIGEKALPTLHTYTVALQELEESYSQWQKSNTTIESSNEHYNKLYDRSLQDLRMLMDDIGEGTFPVAGLPWFAASFGRDSIITSLFMLPLQPAHAIGTLRTLAAYQGTKYDAWCDEEPGKISHEIRFGELANSNQAPFSPYYGGVDSTPLFLILIVEYVRWSGDTSIVHELQTNIDAALDWIDTRSSTNDAHFLTYHQEASEGFPNQGWKDSSNSIIHENGQYAKSPIALVEVQGYIYAAKQGLADIYESMGETDRAKQLYAEAKRLKQQFQDRYWMEEHGFYCIALDENLEQVKSITSNPGHLLMTDIVDEQYRQIVATRLLEHDMFSGYGIRTMSNKASGYYPLSYHNGSVWPHDNGMILLGLLRNRYADDAMKVVSGIIKVSTQFDGYRLPELFCGYDLTETDKVIPYPTTCSPQAWAGATAFVMLQAMLGLIPNVLAGKIFISPCLPVELEYLTVHNLCIGRGTLSFTLKRDTNLAAKINIEIISNTTELEIEIQS